MEPSPQEWLEGFARELLAPEVCDFIAQNEKFLDPPKGGDLTNVHPTRHSWERLDTTLKHINKELGEDGTEMLDPENPLFYPTCVGFVGIETTLAFRDFAKSVDRRVSGEDILNKYPKVQKKVLSLGQEKWNVCIEKLAETVEKSKKITDKQADNVALFMKDLPGELRVVLWGKLTSKGVSKLDVYKPIWKKSMQMVLDVFNVQVPATAAASPTKSAK